MRDGIRSVDHVFMLTGQMSVRAASLLGTSLALCTRSLCRPYLALQPVGEAGPLTLHTLPVGTPRLANGSAQGVFPVCAVGLRKQTEPLRSVL